MSNFRELRIGSLTAKLPIVQGGMGVGVSMSGLASAVANQGGIGVIAAAGLGLFERDAYTDFFDANIRALKKEIKKTREKTQGIIGVNIMVALTNFADYVKAAIDEKIDIIFSGAGLPINLPEFLNGSTHTKLVPIVSSGRAAGVIIKRWFDKYKYVPDAIVVEGPKAGGHLGYKKEQLDDPNCTLENALNDVIEAVKPYKERFGREIPIIAGGGIYTGADIKRFMDMGAAGVQMATRFVTTTECDASEEFKNTYIDATEADIGIIKSPVGLPGRAIRNSFIEQVEAGKRMPYKCPYHCIITCDYVNSPYCIALALMNAHRGNLNNGFAFAGSNAYRAEKIISVKELVEQLEKEYDEEM
ncbi:MAG: nitronate monooxygenase [Firmicutes bacterium HGW-Firmicutes-21]|nr:MAG: nitronate monooxygenase [Firmicutes bacterium HGW-Firmicutes-21]